MSTISERVKGPACNAHRMSRGYSYPIIIIDINLKVNGFSLKERKETPMNPHVIRIIVQAAVQVTEIFIEKWIETKIKKGNRRK
jgi:hypothetical protein